MNFTMMIKPSINPKTRHRLEAVLAADGYSIIGGGQMVDGSMSDISFSRDDPRDKCCADMQPDPLGYDSVCPVCGRTA